MDSAKDFPRDTGTGAKKPEKPLSEAEQREIQEDTNIRSTFEEMIAGAPAGYQVSIARLRPNWCKGWLETLDIEDGQTDLVDLDYIKESWGGQTFVIRLLNPRGHYMASKNIHISSAPKDNGMLIDTPQVSKAKEEALLRSLARDAAPAPPPPQDTSKELMLLLFQNMQDGNKQSIDMLREVMKDKTPSQQMQFAEFFKMFADLEKLKQMTTPEKTEESGDITGMVSSFIEVLKTPQAQGQTQATQNPGVPAPGQLMPGGPGLAKKQPPRMITNPAEVPKPAPVVVETPVSVHPEEPVHSVHQVEPARPLGPAPVSDDISGDASDAIASAVVETDDDEGLSIPEEIATMEPEDIALIIAESLALMPDDKQKEVFNKFQKIGTEE